MKGQKENTMVDFREYLRVEEYLESESDDIFDTMDSITGELRYNESPFAPIEIGRYILHLYASEQNFCSPQINSLDKYDYDAWEVMIEKNHPKYGYVICTAEVMNELGFDKFEPMDHYVAYSDIDTVQQIFDTLLDKLYIPVD